jgi:hypothetical protein
MDELKVLVGSRNTSANKKPKKSKKS